MNQADISTPDTKPAPDAPETKSAPEKGSRFASEVIEFIWETVKVVIISLVIILPIRYYLVQPFFVKGLSMFPTYHDKEYILVDKWTYRTSVPKRGDILLFKAPPDPSEYFIKRIIALPGERIVIESNTVTIYNAEFPSGFELDERGYLPESHVTEGDLDVTLQEEEFFVMGDNRQHSSDSRAFGPVDRNLFSGMSWLRLWPFDRIDLLERFEYPPIIE
jgi:signal peptidase I